MDVFFLSEKRNSAIRRPFGNFISSHLEWPICSLRVSRVEVRREILKSSAKRRLVRGVLTQDVRSFIAIRKEKPLHTSPWGTPFWMGWLEEY